MFSVSEDSYPAQQRALGTPAGGYGSSITGDLPTPQIRRRSDLSVITGEEEDPSFQARHGYRGRRQTAAASGDFLTAPLVSSPYPEQPPLKSGQRYPRKKEVLAPESLTDNRDALHTARVRAADKKQAELAEYNIVLDTHTHLKLQPSLRPPWTKSDREAFLRNDKALRQRDVSKVAAPMSGYTGKVRVLHNKALGIEAFAHAQPQPLAYREPEPAAGSVAQLPQAAPHPTAAGNDTLAAAAQVPPPPPARSQLVSESPQSVGGSEARSPPGDTPARRPGIQELLRQEREKERQKAAELARYNQQLAERKAQDECTRREKEREEYRKLLGEMERCEVQERQERAEEKVRRMKESQGNYFLSIEQRKQLEDSDGNILLRQRQSLRHQESAWDGSNNSGNCEDVGSSPPVAGHWALGAGSSDSQLNDQARLEKQRVLVESWSQDLQHRRERRQREREEWLQAGTSYILTTPTAAASSSSSRATPESSVLSASQSLYAGTYGRREDEQEELAQRRRKADKLAAELRSQINDKHKRLQQELELTRRMELMAVETPLLYNRVQRLM